MVNNGGTAEPTLVCCEPTKTDKLNKIWYDNLRTCSTWCVVPVYNNMRLIPGEKNWCNEIADLLELYKLPAKDKIVNMSKDKFKRLIKTVVKSVAFNKLKEECGTLKKTSSLTYTEFKTQDYLTTSPMSI